MRIGWLYFAPWQEWKVMWRSRDWYGIFRNKPGINPGRWGFFVLGFEFGSRQPNHWFGRTLRLVGLWPW
jgi:hypothetical protein